LFGAAALSSQAMEGALEMAAALLLAGAGAAKLVAPQAAAAMLTRVRRALRNSQHLAVAVRVAGLFELATGAAVLATGSRLPAIAMAAWYLAFAALTVQLARRAPHTSCGCFGPVDAPVGGVHVLLNALCAAIGVAAAIRPPGPLGGVLGHGAVHAAVGTAQAMLLAYLGFLASTALPALAAARRQVAAR
jgi:hypothetical protein